MSEMTVTIRGYLVPCLLFLLKDAPSHGYQLMEILAGGNYSTSISDKGVLYRHLRQMEQDGLVSSFLEQPEGSGRKIYAITDEGRQSLRTWINALEQLKLGLDTFLADAEH